MSYRLTFRFLSEQSDYLISFCFEFNSHILFFLSMIITLKFQNNVRDSIKKKKQTPVFTILVSIKMLNFMKNPVFLCVLCLESWKLTNHLCDMFFNEYVEDPERSHVKMLRNMLHSTTARHKVHYGLRNMQQVRTKLT